MNSQSSHWALEAFGAKNLLEARRLSEQVLVSNAIGTLLNYPYQLRPEDIELLQKATQALLIAASEAWPDLVLPSQDNVQARHEAEGYCSQAFELMRALPLPEAAEPKVFHILQLVTLAYVGQRWSDARRWINEHKQDVVAPSVANSPWDKRILYRLFDAWISLVRKDGWNDLGRVAEIVAGMRKDQSDCEKQFLEGVAADGKSFAAWTLVGLYHLAAATELLAGYLLQGTPTDVGTQVDAHLEKAASAARSSWDAEFEMLVRWLHVASRQMISGSLWRIAHAVNSRVTKYVEYATRSRGLFEMLPPQRAAILEEGLLDPAKRSIVVNLPTSAGKTELAVFRILQALNQFGQDGGWIAYTAPTRALVAQQTRRLRRDLGSIGIQVQQLSGAVEIDSFEDTLLTEQASFDVLVTTPEKLDLVIRNGKVKRPLVLLVVDEAHNIQDLDRGLKLELLLATVKRDCAKASFLLLTPFIPNASDIASWLAPDVDSAKSISFALGPWQPNERVIGLFHANKGDRPRDWNLLFRTLQTTPRTIHLKDEFTVGQSGTLDETFSKLSSSLYLQTAAMAKVFAERENSLVLAVTTDRGDAWSMARRLAAEMPVRDKVSDTVRVVQRFLRTEISDSFELCDMLEKGIAVHHSGMSDETRALVERLAENNDVRIICATTTIAQGINFPVSSVFLASLTYSYGKKMPSRDFWNLAGRAGRIFQESVGVVGIATKQSSTRHQNEIEQYVNEKTLDLVSTLEQLVEDALNAGKALDLDLIINNPQWYAFWGYLSHIYNQAQSAEAMATEAEQVLRNTYGYRSLEKKSKEKAAALLEVVKQFGRRISRDKHLATLADATGFSPESLRSAIGQLSGVIKSSDWQPEGLFGSNRKAFQNLMGVMLNLPEISNQLSKITTQGLEHKHLAELAADWVNGKSIEALARRYFMKHGSKDLTEALSRTCRAIYGHLCISATWGLSALSKLPTSGLDFGKLTEEQKRVINCMPAMIYYGVPTEEAVIMRIHGVPRSIAGNLGTRFKQSEKTFGGGTSTRALEFLRTLGPADWQSAVPPKSTASGSDYQRVWQMLHGLA